MRIRFSWKKFLLWTFGLVIFCGMLGAGAVAALFYWASRDLPSVTRIEDYNPPQATTVLARNGETLGTLCHEKRYVISLKEMSPFLPKAFLAAEDDSFYQHMGVDSRLAEDIDKRCQSEFGKSSDDLFGNSGIKKHRVDISARVAVPECRPGHDNGGNVRESS